MFKKMKLLVLFVFSLTVLVNAQCFQLGVKAEQNLVRTQYDSEIHPYRGFIGITFNAALFPIKSVGIEARAGLVPFIDFYNGPETALLLKYNYELDYPYLYSVFLTGGYVFHRTTGEEHAGRTALPMTIDMPAIGIGVNLFRGLNLELLYLNGRDKAVGSYDPIGSRLNPVHQEVVRLKSVLKLGIGGSFDLFSWKY